MLHVHMLEYSPSLLGDINWGGGSFAQSHMPTALYMYFHNGVIQKYFPGYDYTLPP